MYELYNLINQSGGCSDPEKDMKVAKIFFFCCYVLGHVIDGGRSQCQPVKDVATSIHNTHVLLPSPISEELDGVNTYTEELLTLALTQYGTGMVTTYFSVRRS